MHAFAKTEMQNTCDHEVVPMDGQADSQYMAKVNNFMFVH